MFNPVIRYILCACTGILSGFIGGLGQYFLPEHQIIVQTYPAVVLGVFLFLCGRYILRFTVSNPLLICINLVFFSIIGWRASIDIGYDLGGPVPFLMAGLLGAFFVALGWLLSWNIRSGIIRIVTIISLSGAFAGLIFQVIDTFLEMSEALWTFTLFIEWQVILFITLAVVYRVSGQSP